MRKLLLLCALSLAAQTVDISKSYILYGGQLKAVKVGPGMRASLSGTAILIEAIPVICPPSIVVTNITIATRVSETVYNVPGYVDPTNRPIKVYRNGIFQTPGIDYLQTDAGSVTFNFPISAGDLVTFILGGV